MTQKKVIILGATGSIGSSTLDIIRKKPDLFEIVAFSAHSDQNGYNKIAAEFPKAKSVLSSQSGQKALLEMIRQTDADIVVNGIAGSSGLLPSKEVLESGKDLALANKETIVMAGPLIRQLAKNNNKALLPVDSEHSAVFNMIENFGKDSVSEIILTASGGPFRTLSAKQLNSVTAKDALQHPTWSMGAKITIDSASLANKGLEVIEACRLFDMNPENVKVVVHPQSLVHSLIRTRDGTLYAQISHPDMKHPIFSALTWPLFSESGLKQLNFDSLCTMTFEPPRWEDFPLLGLAYRCAALSKSYTIAYNASNEETVAAFLLGKIRFNQLASITAKVLEYDWGQEPLTFEEILDADARSRNLAKQIIQGL
ncbi:MAG TPA: 1-deoxy-D-xylulose-5-phosphate reductoisomerase [Treponemataceae bacterium]|nr:1-deoxy-D-xylulose-5-phosphate reductoisomerase [Treponemataceae bacterium]